MRRWLGIAMMVVALAGMPASAKTQADAAAVKLPGDPLAVLTKHSVWLNVAGPLRPDDLHGRIVLLAFWRAGCADCVAANDDIAQLEKTYGAQLAVVGVHSGRFEGEKDMETVRNAVLRAGIQHPVINDYSGAIARMFHIADLPSHVLLNARGGIEQVFSGEGHFDEISAAIEQVAKRYSGRLRHDPIPLKREVEGVGYSLLDFPGKITYMPRYRSGPALIVADGGHDRVVMCDLDGKVLEVIGTGQRGHNDGHFEDARFSRPEGIAVAGDVVYIADTGNHLLRAANLVTRKVTTLAGNGALAAPPGTGSMVAAKASLASPWDIALWPDANHIAIAMAGANQLWSYTISDKTISVLAGSGQKGLADGSALAAQLAQPMGLAAMGDRLYFVDADTSSLRVLEKGQVRTLIGSGQDDYGYKPGVKGKALMQYPAGVAALGDSVYIADSYNHAIRRYDVKKGVLEDYAGTGLRGKNSGPQEHASFSQPEGVVAAGKKLYMADTANRTLRLVDEESGEVTLLGVHEETQKEPVTLQSQLPNITDDDPIRLAVDAPVRISIKLKQGWRINPEAPSYMALFDLVKNNEAVVSFDRTMLQQNRMLIPPRLGLRYRLQGTFFYCEESKESACLIKSINMPVSFEDGAPKQYTIDINK